LETKINNNKIIKDDRNKKVEAHGGGFIKKDDYFYWFGENRLGIKKVTCYRSRDLKNWEYRNDVLTLTSPTEKHYIDTDLDLNPFDDADKKFDCGATIERPKVLYNEKTRKYVMWMHYENGRDYSCARAAVAVSDTVDGDYTYLGSFRPQNYMSRDCTLFKDEDGTAYFISAARNNADLHIYKLTDDYLNIEDTVNKIWINKYREAPALIKRGQYYILVTSGCTGWTPNQGKYGYTADLEGDWSELFDLGDETTYDTQPTYIIEIEGANTGYLYVGDRWDGEEYHNSEYKFLPLEVSVDKENVSVKLMWTEKVNIDFEAGKIY